MKKYAILSLMAVLALGACDDDDSTGNEQTAQIRVINATTATTGTNSFGSVGLFRNTSQVVGGIAAGTNTGTVNASGCGTTYTVPAGQQTLHFRATGQATQVGSVTHTFVANQKYIVILYGNNNTGLQSRVIQETQANAGTNMRRIRFFNASTSATAGDVYATATATTAPSGTATASNLAGGAASSYVDVANTNNAFRFYNTSTTTPTATTTARTSFPLSTTGFPASGNAMVIFTDAGAFQVNSCT